MKTLQRIVFATAMTVVMIYAVIKTESWIWIAIEAVIYLGVCSLYVAIVEAEEIDEDKRI